MKTLRLIIASALLPACSYAMAPKPAAKVSAPAVALATDPAEIQAIAKEAWIYAYPMMDSYNTWYAQTVLKDSPKYIGGFNRYRHYSDAYTPANTDIVTPNNDTPYSWAWLDLRTEPIVITVPEVPVGRYYVLQFIDLFTFNNAYVGSRSTGNAAGHFLFVGPQWKGEIPAGFKQVFKSETEIVGILGRTQLDGPEDVEAVKKIQAGYQLTPLSAFQKKPAPPAAPALDFPVYEKSKTETPDFIGYLNFFLSLAQPPHPREVALRQSFARIGIVPGQPWDASKVPLATLAAIDAGVKQGRAELDAKLAVSFSSKGLIGSREVLRENYLGRGVAAAKGIYGNDLEEAWYGGYAGDGTKLSQIHFSKDQLPPAKFFWSVTLYTLPERFLSENSLNRYSIGDRTKGLKYDTDGGLTIYVGHASPGSDKESNWLPAPAERYSLVARLYGPGEAAMKDEWKLPPLQPVK